MIIVCVTAPTEKETEYICKIKMINSDDSNDYCEVDVFLKTPRNKIVIRPFLHILQSHPNMFPILQLLIQRLGLQ